MPIELRIFQIVVLILSVVIHEVSHGYMAEKLGDPTARLAGRLTLNPIPHIDMWGSIILPFFFVLSGSPVIFGWAKPVPYNPYNLKNQKWGDALVGAAGPLSNIAIAIIFGVVGRLLLGAGYGGGVAMLAIYIIVLINILLAVINLIPIPPLDGSKIVFSALPYSYSRFMHLSPMYGFILVLAFIIIFQGPISQLVFYLSGLLTGFTL